jgi:hypothetical protein
MQPIPVDLTTPADHELLAQRTAELEPLIAQREIEVAEASAAWDAAIEHQCEIDPSADWGTLDEGCQCPHVSAPCSFCTMMSEETVEAMDALSGAEQDLATARRELAQARRTVLPTMLAVTVVPEVELGCEDTTTDYAFTAFDVGVVSRKCTSRATWRILRHDGTFRHVCDHCCEWNHSKWSQPVKTPIYTSPQDRRTGNMGCADRIRGQAHAAKLIAAGGGGRQTNAPTPGTFYTEDIGRVVAAQSPGSALPSVGKVVSEALKGS